MPGHVDLYCDLAGMETETALSVLLGNDGSFCTLIRVRGTTTLMSAEEFADAMSVRLAEPIGALMKKPGHLLSISYERHANTDLCADQAGAFMRGRSDGKALDVGGLIAETEAIIREQSVEETILVACWTFPTAAAPSELARDRNDHKRRTDAAGALGIGLSRSLRLKSLDGLHTAFVHQIAEALTDAGVAIEILLGRENGARPDLTEISRALLFHQTPLDWRPRAPNEATYFQPKRRGVETDLGGFFAPPLAHQLMNAGAKVSPDHTEIAFGSRRYGLAIVTMFPRYLPRFNLIPAALAHQRVPLRVTFHLESGPVAGDWKTMLKRVLAGVMSKLSPDNANYFRAIRAIEASTGEDLVTFARTRIVAATWIEPSEPQDLLARRRALLVQTLKSWGEASVADVAPDPLRALVETVPGATMSGVAAPAAIAPVGDVVLALPFHRPAPVFSQGETIFLDPAGKVAPHEALSQSLASWLTLIFASPGKGKSMLMNRLNYDFCAYGAGGRLPLLGVIDIGVSSSGLIQTLSEALPVHRRREVAYVRLLNNRDNAINCFDVGLGLRSPLDRERTFIANFLKILLRMEDSTGSELLARVITRLYRTKSDLEMSGSPNRWQRNVNPDLDTFCERHGVMLQERTTYWQITDALMQLGYPDWAAVAQRGAAPILEDVVAVLALPELQADYPNHANKALRTAETAVAEFPLFSHPTVLDLGEARVASIDLNDVVLRDPSSPDAQRSNALMFLLARHLFLRRISGRVDEIPHMELPNAEEIRGAYRHWWENHYAIMQETPKRLCMDEYHVTGGGSSIAAQVEADTREGRKWGLEIILASQLLGDFGRLRNLASAVFILNGETQEIRHEAKEIFGFSDAVLDVMTRDLTGPREGRGANFLARYTVSSGERWVLLNHRVGARLLWALTTKHQDRLLRDEMYRRLSTTEALAFLARRFPEGTALPYWQRLVDEISDQPVAVRAANALLAEYLRMARTDDRSAAAHTLTSSHS
jgi:intracellular multiplication protein IcmB